MDMNLDYRELARDARRALDPKGHCGRRYRRPDRHHNYKLYGPRPILNPNFYSTTDLTDLTD